MKDAPDRWQIRYQLPKPAAKAGALTFRLALTAFKHVGVFPEQAVNWDYIYRSVKALNLEQPRAQPVCLHRRRFARRAAGADVTTSTPSGGGQLGTGEHELSQQQDIRWLVEDAMTFVRREVKRGKKYHGIILDPPAYGHGTDGQKWKLEDMINEMVQHVRALLEEKHFRPQHLFARLFPASSSKTSSPIVLALETGELYLQATCGGSCRWGFWEGCSS